VEHLAQAPVPADELAIQAADHYALDRRVELSAHLRRVTGQSLIVGRQARFGLVEGSRLLLNP